MMMINNRRVSRRRLAAAVASVAALSVGGGFMLDAASASAQTAAQQQVSQNWSGYVVNSSAGQNFSSVSGSWTEPTVSSSSASQGYAAFWVGLGGASDQSQSLEQVGTGAQVVNGKVTHYAWYELVPDAQQTLALTIHPGDHMTGKVTVDGTAVTISLSDTTTGQSVTKTLQMSSPDTSSAEWIAEAPAAEYPNGGTQILPLADFGKVTFTDALATAGGHTGSISDPAWTAEQVDLSPTTSDRALAGDGAIGDPAEGASLSQQSAGGASTSAVSGDGRTFTVSYSSVAQSSSVGATGGYGGYGAPGYGYGGYGYPGSGYAYPGYGYGYPGGYAYGYPGGYIIAIQ